MARKRQIDPKYPFKDEIASLSIAARYFYILSWCQMDDANGVLPYSSRELKRQIFPDDDIDVDAIILELITNRRLICFEVNGKKWLWCPAFEEHQTINHPSKSHYPSPPKTLRESYRTTPVPLPQSREGRVERVEKNKKDINIVEKIPKGVLTNILTTFRNEKELVVKNEQAFWARHSKPAKQLWLEANKDEEACVNAIKWLSKNYGAKGLDWKLETVAAKLPEFWKHKEMPDILKKYGGGK